MCECSVCALPAEVNRCHSVQTGVYFRRVEVGQLVARKQSLGITHVTQVSVSPVFLSVSQLGAISLYCKQLLDTPLRTYRRYFY